MNGQAMPLCSICWETLGKYGGPVTLPCGEPLCIAYECCTDAVTQIIANVLDVTLTHLGAGPSHQGGFHPCGDLLQVLLTLYHHMCCDAQGTTAAFIAWHSCSAPSRSALCAEQRSPQVRSSSMLSCQTLTAYRSISTTSSEQARPASQPLPCLAASTIRSKAGSAESMEWPALVEIVMVLISWENGTPWQP